MSINKNLLIFTLIVISNNIYSQNRSVAKQYYDSMKKINKYEQIDIIKWTEQDDRDNREEMLLLLSGSYLGIASQLFNTSISWFNKFTDDLGTNGDNREKSDDIAEEDLNKLKESSDSYYPYYSYKATVNNNHDVYFIIGRYQSLGLRKWHIVMITYRFDMVFNDKKGIEMRPVWGEPKAFEFNVRIPQKMSAFDGIIKLE